MMIVGSVYDQYGPCSTCGAPEASPCIDSRSKYGRPLRFGSAHRGRVVRDGSPAEKLVDLGWCIRCKRRLVPPGRRKLCSDECRRARNREETNLRRRRQRAARSAARLRAQSNAKRRLASERAQFAADNNLLPLDDAARALGVGRRTLSGLTVTGPGRAKFVAVDALREWISNVRAGVR